MGALNLKYKLWAQTRRAHHKLAMIGIGEPNSDRLVDEEDIGDGVP